MIHQINPFSIDIRVGASKYQSHVRESISIKFTSTTIYFNGFVSPYRITTKNKMSEIKGILPDDPNIISPKYDYTNSWMFYRYSCPIKNVFFNDHFRNPIKDAVCRELGSLLS